MPTFHDKNLGFRISAQEDWVMLPSAWVKQFRSTGSATSAELADILRKASEPFVCFYLPQEDPMAAIPAVQCTAKPLSVVDVLGGLGGIIDATLQQLMPAVPDLSVLERQDDIIFAGVHGAYMKASMSVLNQAHDRFECLSELYVLQSKRALFILGLSGPLHEEQRPTEDFHEIIRSIRIA